jgi:transcriptional regulator with XRE-family HTH domain
MGISQNAYSKIENNLTQLTVTHVKQLSAILDVPVIDLMKDEFEIRRPYKLVTKQVSKREIILFTHELQHRMKLKSKEEHKLYNAILAILQTASDIAEDID